MLLDRAKATIGINRFSVLSRRQQSLFLFGWIFGIVMIANTLYLLFASHVAGIGKDPEVLPVFYQLMLITHLLLGIIFVGVALIFASLHIYKIFTGKRRRAWMRISGFVFVMAVMILFFSGFFILSEANSRENAWIFIAHQVTAALFLIAYLVHRFMSRVKPKIPFYNASGKKTALKQKDKISSATACLLAAILAWTIVQADFAAAEAFATQSDTYVVETTNQLAAALAESYQFVPAGDPRSGSPFFPATTTTSTGGWLPARIITHDDLPDMDAFVAETREKGFAPSYFLGAQSCARCHADTVEQWSKSAHRFSSFNNPFYRKAVELTREKIGKQPSQFCGGCHDPAIMFAGNMLNEIDPLVPESQAGITCLGCHAIDQIHGVVGNGNYNIHDKTESPYLFDQVKGGFGEEVHDYILKAKPTVHKQRNLKPVFQKSEFCMACHKVNLDVAVNNYRWLRGQNEYDAWHNSGIARNQPQTWYEPPTVRQCQDCHMPLERAERDVAADNGFIRSHRFAIGGVNTALPAIRGDYDTIKRMEEDLRDEKLRLEIFAVRRENGELIMNANEAQIQVFPGEIIQVDVVVRNLNVGHTFPGGTNDSNQGWIDFKVAAADRVVFHNGFVDANRFVDPAAHFYQAVIVDRHSERISKRNASDIYATVYANVIPPSTSDIARYRFKVPEDMVNQVISIDARLMWRKFNRTFTEFVFEGQEVPDLPITEVETDSITLSITDTPEPAIVTATAEDNKRWMRYNDYGIGSVLDDDTRTALAAFRKVAELVPEKMDGYLNQARAYIMEGSLAEAETYLRIASEKAPNEARIAFFWGSLLEKQGRFPESIEAFKRTLQSYPQSRDTLVRLGRVYWLNGDYAESIEAYKSVLAIDPEHALAFHQLSLAYKALAANANSPADKERYSANAAEYLKGFEKYKIDEDGAHVTQKYREKNPYDNLMSQKLVIHDEG